MTASHPVDDAKRIARLTGALLLVMAVSAIIAEFGARAGLIVPDDARATAENLAGAPRLARAGVAGFLLVFLLDVPVAVLFYALVRRVQPIFAMIAMAARLVYAAAVGAVLAAYAAGLHVLSSDTVASAFGLEAQQALGLTLLDTYDLGFMLALTFFGMHLALIGWLLLRSRMVPVVLGALVGLGGLAYLANAGIALLAPALHASVSPVLDVLGFGEILLALWLVVMGVRPPDRAGR